jgi:hypothetical protein
MILLQVQDGATWQVGYRPSQMRVTLNVAFTGSRSASARLYDTSFMNWSSDVVSLVNGTNQIIANIGLETNNIGYLGVYLEDEESMTTFEITNIEFKE